MGNDGTTSGSGIDGKRSVRGMMNELLCLVTVECRREYRRSPIDWPYQTHTTNGTDRHKVPVQSTISDPSIPRDCTSMVVVGHIMTNSPFLARNCRIGIIGRIRSMTRKIQRYG